ncbi:MAG: DUF362 domain-containing protein [Anaerolineales bacterium]|nr:DUF362 domain-containing protein [Anaerolineales bacterium]
MKNHKSRAALSRRSFLQLLALGAASSLAAVCSRLGLPAPTSPTLASGGTSMAPTTTVQSAMPLAVPQTPTQQAGFNPGQARVAFVKTGDRKEGVRKAIELLGINPVESKRVFLKPNYNSADPAPGSTHPDVLRAMVEVLDEMDAATISVGDRSGMGNTRQVMETAGVFAMGEEMGFATLVFDELPAEDWVMVKLPESHWKRGFPIARPCLDADAVVQACCLKTHQYGGHFTLSLKNSVGMVGKVIPGDSYNFMDELHSSKDQRRMIAEINAAYTPALIVMDGVEAFTSGGPHQGNLVNAGVVLAAADRVAIDAVGVALLRYFGTTKEVSRGPVFQLEQLARAVELGLGVDGPQKITLVTGDEASAAFAAEIEASLA